MKTLPWILVLLLALACVAAWLKPRKVEIATKTETKIRTVIKVDTQLISAPMPVFWQFTGESIHIGDTVVLREQMTYRDSSYTAYVSGVAPRLDSLITYPCTLFQTITNDIYHTLAPKRKRLGIGLQAGYGYPGGAYVGIGVSWNLWQW